ncbi:MAG: S-layer family protein [Microcoleus sp. SM1_3_4]|nr:S-layer family protein [Microcoleus sp. SM1_3_4]
MTATLKSAVNQYLFDRPASGDSGNISITSRAGSIDTRAGDLDSRTNNGNAGSITLQARDNITARNVTPLLYATGSGNSGNINITSTEGAIDILNVLDTGVTFGNGGSILLNAKNNILLNNVYTRVTNNGVGVSGNISITSTAGNINIAGIMSTLADNDTGGAISVNAAGNITATEISSTGKQEGGAITLNSGGTINLESLNADGENKQGGNITVRSQNGIQVAPANPIFSRSNGGNGGDITLSNVNGNIQIGSVRAESKSQGGDINITNTNGSVNTDQLVAGSEISGGATPFKTAQGGNISVTAGSNITTTIVGSQAQQQGGTITFNSGGSINTGAILTSGNNGGNLFLQAVGSISTANGVIDTTGSNNGGNITLQAGTSIDTTSGIINAMGGNNGGNISLQATGNINTAGIGSAVLLSGFNENSGTLRIESGANIDTTAGPIITAAARGTGGNVTIDAKGNAATSDINSQTFSNNAALTGGKIDIRASSITAGGEIVTNRNDITFAAPVTLADKLSVSILNTGNLNFTGNINFNSTVNGPYNLTVIPAKEGIVQFNGAVAVPRNPIESIKIEGNIPNNPVAINFITTNNISVGNITSPAGISLYSYNGEIKAGNLDTSPLNLTSPNNGGPIDLNAGTNITAGNISTSAIGNSASGNGGDISIDAIGNINIGTINSSATGNAGNVTIDNRSPSGNTALNYINAQSRGNGRGGNISIWTGNFFRSSSSFKDRNGGDASISTAGSTADNGGTIFLRHGGNGQTYFIVGEPAINGTQAAITRGNGAQSTILPGNKYLHTYKQDGEKIEIQSRPAPTPTPAPTPRTCASTRTDSSTCANSHTRADSGTYTDSRTCYYFSTCTHSNACSDSCAVRTGYC